MAPPPVVALQAAQGAKQQDQIAKAFADMQAAQKQAAPFIGGLANFSSSPTLATYSSAASLTAQ